MQIKDHCPVTVTFALLSFVGTLLYPAFFMKPLWFFYHGDFTHFSNNMVLFLIIGALFEKEYGVRHTLGMLAIVSVVVPLLHIGSFPIGASGHLFAFLGASIFFKGSKYTFHSFLVSIIYLGTEIYNSLQADNISQLAHISGFIIGAIYVKVLGKSYGKASD